jgi:ATP-dependent Clp protease protease subunit
VKLLKIKKKALPLNLQMFASKEEKPKYYSMAVKDTVADVYIFGDITSWEWFENDVSSFTLTKELQALGSEVESIRVHINSYGGEVAEGLAIYNILRNHKAKVTTICEGFACSIASVIFMAGDERIMNNASLLMIHNAWMYTAGNAAQLRKDAEDLEKITQASIEAYKGRATISEEEIKSLLDAETWLLPSDALDKGFATSVVSEPMSNRAAASARKAMFKMVADNLKSRPEPYQSTEPEPTVDPVDPVEPDEPIAEPVVEPGSAPEENTVKKMLLAILK